MSKDALTRALLRRERLRSRIAQQRTDIEVSFAGLARPVALIDGAVNTARTLRAHPAAVAVLVAAAVVLRGRTLFRVVTRAIGMWRLLRHVSTLVGRFGS